MINNAKNEKKKFFKAQNIFISVMLAYPLLNFIVFYVIINANSLLLAFQTIDKDHNYSFAGFQNFVNVYNSLKLDGVLWISIRNTVVMFVVTLIIGLPLNILFSYFIHKKIIGHKAIRTTLMLPAMVSGVIIALLFLKFMEEAIPNVLAQFFNTTLSTSLLKDVKYAFSILIFFTLWTGFSTSLIIYSNAMNSISPEVIESAKIDGATHLQEIWFIILPLIYPTISTFMITGVASLFSGMGPLYLFYGNNPANAPREVYLTGYYLFLKTLGVEATLRDYPFASAVGLMFTFIAVPLTLFVKRLLEKKDPLSD